MTKNLNLRYHSILGNIRLLEGAKSLTFDRWFNKVTTIPFSKIYQSLYNESSLTGNSETNHSRQYCAYIPQSLCAELPNPNTGDSLCEGSHWQSAVHTHLYPPLSNKRKVRVELRQSFFGQIKLLNNSFLLRFGFLDIFPTYCNGKKTEILHQQETSNWFHNFYLHTKMCNIGESGVRNSCRKAICRPLHLGFHLGRRWLHSVQR